MPATFRSGSTRPALVSPSFLARYRDRARRRGRWLVLALLAAGLLVAAVWLL